MTIDRLAPLAIAAILGLACSSGSSPDSGQGGAAPSASASGAGGAGGGSTGLGGGSASVGASASSTGTSSSAASGAGGQSACDLEAKDVAAKLSLAQVCPFGGPPSVCADVVGGLCCPVVVTDKNSPKAVEYQKA